MEVSRLQVKMWVVVCSWLLHRAISDGLRGRRDIALLRVGELVAWCVYFPPACGGDGGRRSRSALAGSTVVVDDIEGVAGRASE